MCSHHVVISTSDGDILIVLFVGVHSEPRKQGLVLVGNAVGEHFDREVLHPGLTLVVLKLALDHDIEALKKKVVEVLLHCLL